MYVHTLFHFLFTISLRGHYYCSYCKDNQMEAQRGLRDPQWHTTRRWGNLDWSPGLPSVHFFIHWVSAEHCPYTGTYSSSLEYSIEQSIKKSPINTHWKDWCLSWRCNPLATWCEELTHWKRPWCRERLKAGEGTDRGWDGWMASPTR